MSETQKALIDAGVPPDRVDSIMDLAAMAEEELHPDLEEYVYEDDTWGRMLKHPLVFQIPFSLPGHANRAYAQKQSHLDTAIEKQDWHSVVFLHERAYRLYALIEYVVGRDEYDVPIPLSSYDQMVRDLAADVWVDSENIEQNLEDWAALFADPDPLMFASRGERIEFAMLPETLTVYRAGIDDGGWSWTLDPKVAVFFAKRFGASHSMIEGKVKKDLAFGFLSRRSESEVLVPEGAVTDIKPYQA